MPKISDHQSKNTTKLLFIGDSGAGKSGALASLAAAGYSLRILDLDNGLDVLKNYLTDPASTYVKENPKCADTVYFETVTDTMKNVGGKIVPAKATVWSRSIALLDNWTDSESKEKLGGIGDWGSNDILVVDSLTMLSTAALQFVLSMNGRLGQQPHQSDWGQGQQLVEGFLQKLYDDSVKCNVVVNCHITYIGEENGPQRAYPNSLGKALPPKIGRYFNSSLMARSTGQGASLKRKILTNTTGILDLKNTAPLRVKPEYDLDTGLAEYFKAVRGQSKPEAVVRPKPPAPATATSTVSGSPTLHTTN